MLGLCTPSVVYLIISTLIAIGIVAYNIYKGEEVSYLSLASQVLSIVCCVIILNFLCFYNTILAWVVMFLPLLSSLAFMNNVRVQMMGENKK